MEVSVRELRDHLSEYLRRVEAGEVFIVTSHGRAVARLGTTTGMESPEPEEMALPRLLGRSWVSPARDDAAPGSEGRPASPVPGAPGNEEILEGIKE